VELLAGFQTGFGTLGLRLGFADYKSKVSQTDASITNSASSSAQQTQLSIGLHSGGLDLVLTLDPAGYQKLTEDANSQETSTKVKGGATTFDFRWLQSESSSSPYVTAKLVSREFKASGSTAGRDFSSKFSDQFMTLEGGYVAMKDVHGPRFYTGAQFLKNASKGPSITGTGATAAPSYAANDETAKLDTTVLSATMGGEATVMGGFGLMAGMSYVVYGDVVSKDNTTNQDIKVTKSFAETSDDTLWSLGAYYKVDALRIDASYGKEFLYKGPYLISGASTSPLLTKISASYAF